MTDRPTLFDTLQIGAARRSDPATSKRAGARQGTSARTAILHAFREHGPMTDDELAALVTAHGHLGSTVKTARSALKGLGFVVDTGRTKETARGSDQIVWALHPKYRPTDTIADPQGRVA